MTLQFRHYSVLERLAIGGMAILDRVCATSAENRDQRYVMKRLLPEHQRDQCWREMFRHEIEITSSLSHENCIRFHEAGEYDDQLYLVLEEVKGPHLGQLFGAALRRNQPMPARICVEILRQLALALDHLHQWAPNGSRKSWRAVHRDVCPQNVLIDQDGRVRLIDFGLAYSKAAPPALAATVVRGRPGYMSPEQCRGEPIDPRSDVFSWGIVAYEILSRRRLFKGDSREALLAINARAEIASLQNQNPSLGESLYEIVHAALAKEAAERTFSLWEISQKLSMWQQSMGEIPGPSLLADWMRDEDEVRREKNGADMLSSPTVGEP